MYGDTFNFAYQVPYVIPYVSSAEMKPRHVNVLLHTWEACTWQKLEGPNIFDTICESLKMVCFLPGWWALCVISLLIMRGVGVFFAWLVGIVCH